MEIEVKFGEPLWRAVGKRRLRLCFEGEDRVTVGRVLARVAGDYPGFPAAFAGQGLVQAYPYRVFVDAVLIQPAAAGPADADQPEAYPTTLRDGQTVFVLLPAAGG